MNIKRPTILVPGVLLPLEKLLHDYPEQTWTVTILDFQAASGVSAKWIQTRESEPVTILSFLRFYKVLFYFTRVEAPRFVGSRFSMRLHPCEFSVGRKTNAWILLIFKHFFFCAATTMHNGWISVIQVHNYFPPSKVLDVDVSWKHSPLLQDRKIPEAGTCKPCATRSKRTGGLLDRSTCVLAVPANVHNTILLMCLLHWLRVNTTLTESQVVQSQ